MVGGQAPNAFGGYDYAKLMRKVQFIEAYNLGSSQALIRSFNPHNAIPAVTTHFHQSVADDIWQTWYYLAHGNRGFIGWVQDWFDGPKPKAWHDQVAPHYREAAHKIGPLLAGAEWIDDGVAIYYSHPSIQLGWILDAAAHGKTWINRAKKWGQRATGCYRTVSPLGRCLFDRWRFSGAPRLAYLSKTPPENEAPRKTTGSPAKSSSASRTERTWLAALRPPAKQGPCPPA